jgi:hypothetical protein
MLDEMLRRALQRQCEGEQVFKFQFRCIKSAFPALTADTTANPRWNERLANDDREPRVGGTDFRDLKFGV